MKKYVVLLFVAGLLLGCARTMPLEAVETPVARKTTRNSVEKAILAAGKEQGWSMSVTKKGTIKAEKEVKGEQASSVLVVYTAAKYKISYITSVNMMYDPETNTIHRNYSLWVDELDNAIQARLGAGTAGRDHLESSSSSSAFR